MRHPGIVLPLVAVAIGAPGPRSDLHAGVEPDAVVEMASDHYDAGDVASLRLRNPLDEPVGFNACTWTLQLRFDHGWDTAPYEDARVCTMELRLLAPGETAVPEFGLDERLPAGEYRLRAVLHRRDSESREVRHSGPFYVDR